MIRSFALGRGTTSFRVHKSTIWADAPTRCEPWYPSVLVGHSSWKSVLVGIMLIKDDWTCHWKLLPNGCQATYWIAESSLARKHPKQPSHIDFENWFYFAYESIRILLIFLHLGSSTRLRKYCGGMEKRHVFQGRRLVWSWLRGNIITFPRKVECSVNFFYEAQETNFLNNVAFQKTLVVLLEAVMDSF